MREIFTSLTLKPYEETAVVNHKDDGNDTTASRVIPFLSSCNPSSNVVTYNNNNNNKGNKWYITSYYYDSYGGANIRIPLQLQFSSKDSLNTFLLQSSNKDVCCIQPKPINYDEYMKENCISENKNDAEGDNDEHLTSSISDAKTAVPHNNTIPSSSSSSSFTLPVVCIEAKVILTFGTGHAMTSKVEDVHIISTYIDIETNSIILYTNIKIRISHVILENDNNTQQQQQEQQQLQNTTGTTIIDPIEASKMKLNLEIMASYYYYTTTNSQNDNSDVVIVPKTSVYRNNKDNYESALQLLSLSTTSMNYHHDHNQPGQVVSSFSLSSSSNSNIHRFITAVPLELYVSLIHTLQISKPRIVSHPTIMNMTYIAFTMTNKNIQHTDPIHITNITLHPQQQQYYNNNDTTNTTTTTSKRKNTGFHWGFVSTSSATTTTTNNNGPSASPISENIITSNNMIYNNNDSSSCNTTITIQPNESQSILLFVQHQQSSSPLSVSNNIIVSNDDDDDDGSGNINIKMDESMFTRQCTLTISTSTNNTATAMSSSSTTVANEEAVYTTNITYRTTPTTTGTTTLTSLNRNSKDESDMLHIFMSLDQQPSPSLDENKNAAILHTCLSKNKKNTVSLGTPFIVNIDITDSDPVVYNTTNLKFKLVVVDMNSKQQNDHLTTDTTTTTTTTTGQPNRDHNNNTKKSVQVGDDLFMIDTNVDVLLVHNNDSTVPTTLRRGQLRMIPLRTGTITIPNFYIRIMDTTTGTDENGGNNKYYYCYHKFQVIVQ